MIRLLFAAAMLLSPLPVLAQDAPAGAPKPAEKAKPAPPPKPQLSRTERLNDLFARLEKARDEEEAKGITGQIERIWKQSGSATADVIFERVGTAMNAQNFDLALDLLDTLVTLEPKWAEAWNARATLHFMRNDYDGSVRDIVKVLELEPRHYGALAGLAMIYQTMDNIAGAVRAARAVQKLNPHAPGMKELIDRFGMQADGQGI
jgi:tetratricopeptide (TPR) repeat protein